jgi:hypothetical protein
MAARPLPKQYDLPEWWTVPRAGTGLVDLLYRGYFSTIKVAWIMRQAVRLITFRDGTLTAIKPFVTVTEPVDVTINGEATFWRNLLLLEPPPGYQNLYAAVRAETCHVTGNAELYWAYFAALTRLFDVMRDIENNR